MTWARSATTPDDKGRFAVVQAAYKVTCEAQSHRAARIVASHSEGVQDCAELLAMLGLEAAGGRTPAGSA